MGKKIQSPMRESGTSYRDSTKILTAFEEIIYNWLFFSSHLITLLSFDHLHHKNTRFELHTSSACLVY